MTVSILRSVGKFDEEEYEYLLRGGSSLNTSDDSPPNPDVSWISDQMWEMITSLQRLPRFGSLVENVTNSSSSWEEWYRQEKPEITAPPSNPDSSDGLHRLILLKVFRPDRVIFGVTEYVKSILGRKYTEPPVLDLRDTLHDSTPLSPLIFVLSPGVDPTENLFKLANQVGMRDRVVTVALGQGQAPVATKLIRDGLRLGHWVFLANCHLMTSWLPTLEKIIQDMDSPHPDFRLWLSSNPSPLFPMSILQRGIKMTTEPPKGLHSNLLRLYHSLNPDHISTSTKPRTYSRLLFALTFFHSILLERRKFRSLGLNIPYDFNDTDFKVSDDLLKTYLDQYDDIPWDALKYLIAEANYGGRVTDELDRRVLGSYLSRLYCPAAVESVGFKLSSSEIYFIPDDLSLDGSISYIKSLPVTDPPEAFGQHPNAEISYLKEDSNGLIHSLLQLQPISSPKTQNQSARSSPSVEDKARDLLQTLPPPFDLDKAIASKSDDPSALHVVFFQELERYNQLINSVRNSCSSLLKGIKGLIVMSSDLEEIFAALNNGLVPKTWLRAYPSLKPLGSWIKDLLQRLDQLSSWLKSGYPTVYWLSGFTYPTGFLTAVLQTASRKNSLPIDSLMFEVSVAKDVSGPPEEGVLVKGVYLEGAGWNFKKNVLTEPRSMELHVEMPILHFKPVKENQNQSIQGYYLCPLYLYPNRSGTPQRRSHLMDIRLPAAVTTPDHWIFRGTALLLAV